MLDEFYVRLASIGKLPGHRMNPRSRLEYARHHGVPSPLIDFSYSPYIALWMAFNGIRPTSDRAAVYALNLNGLGTLWQKYTADNEAFDRFRWNRTPLFDKEFPVNALQAVLFPASWNTRMQRQMGLFIYDSLQYGREVPYQDLEDFVEQGKDPTGPDGNPTFALHKIIIPHSIVSDVFERLDLMGVDGTRLYDNHEGAVADVVNGYVYESRSGVAHDLDNSDRDPWALSP